MIIEKKAQPYSLIVSAENRIRHLTSAVLILREHMKKFGKDMKVKAPKAYSFITTKISEMERELQIRRDFMIPYTNPSSFKH